MNRTWRVWWSVTALIAGYAVLGFVASRPTSLDIVLQPLYPIRFTVFRFVDDPLRLSLSFRAERGRRPELGEWASDSSAPGFLQFANPGASIRFTASTQDAETIFVEAMPASAFGSGFVMRNVSSNLPVRYGVWRWPPPDDMPKIVLRPGFTTVTMEIVAVDPPLLDERVGLTVEPPLSLKVCMPGVCWLGFWVLWPVAAGLQLLGVIGIVVYRRTRKRREQRV